MLKLVLVLFFAAAASSNQLDSYYGEWIPVAGYLNQMSQSCLKITLKSTDGAKCTCSDGKEATPVEMTSAYFNGGISNDDKTPMPVAFVENPADILTNADATCKCGDKEHKRIVLTKLSEDYSILVEHEESGLTNPISPYYVYVISKKVPSDKNLENFIKNTEFFNGKQVTVVCDESIAAA